MCQECLHVAGFMWSGLIGGGIIYLKCYWQKSYLKSWIVNLIKQRKGSLV